MMTATDRTWAEVNLDAIAHNYREILNLTGVPVMCVLKAWAYGHGEAALAKRLAAEGCANFGVATFDEAIELRKHVNSPILVFNHVGDGNIGFAILNSVTLTVYDLVYAEKVSTVASKLGKTADIHIKIDTGMTRVGFNLGDADNAVRRIDEMPNVNIVGIYTHFACADEADRTYTEMQIMRFKAVAAEAKVILDRPIIFHAANSAASLMYPSAYCDMVRLGISLYGCYPSEAVEKTRANFKKALSLKTRIYRVNTVPVGTKVSYGGIFITQRETKIATLPIGYADGVSRGLSGKLHVLVNGYRAPVIGRICMDQMMVDITDVNGGVCVGDEVVIIGKQGADEITVEEIAALMGTINYEVLCLIGRRVPRIYVGNVV
ncbi:MAG: alanine racemase [Defluviitaleaceae bacterium]|nr:alanine racemase [Defluviitaleaceae bacterium]